MKKKHTSSLLFGIGTFLVIFSVFLDDLIGFLALNALGEKLRQRGTKSSDEK